MITLYAFLDKLLGIVLIDKIAFVSVQELSLLQDRVPAFSPDMAVDIIERELGGPLTAHFLSFERSPIAAASLGQVSGFLHCEETTSDGFWSTSGLAELLTPERFGYVLSLWYGMAPGGCPAY